VFSFIVKQASQLPAINIINYEWLMTSVNDKAKSDGCKGKKRTRSETPIDVNPLRQEVTKGLRAKKQKYGNKAKSGSLRIPLDETCNAPGKCL
jgi:hypothetical protein